MSKSKNRSKRKRIVALAAATLLVVTIYAGLKLGSLNSPEDIKPTIYTCSTPLGGFQVSSEQATVKLDNNTYTFSDDHQEVSVSAVMCVSQVQK